MSLDATKPNDQDLISEFAALLRETRAAINASSISAGLTVTQVAALTGTRDLVTGTNVSDVSIEIIRLTGAALSIIRGITGGRDGQIKVFIAEDTNVGLTDGDGNFDNGRLYLNQTAGTVYNIDTGEVIAIVNIGGDPDSDADGFWQELFRTTSNR